MRTARLLELLLVLQARRRATASELAEALEVSVRTVYRDIATLAAAGVPVYTEPGRHGGVRLLDTFVAESGAPLEAEHARALVLAGVPSVAAAVGLGAAPHGGATARAATEVRDRLLVESEPWWGDQPAEPFLAEIARAVWESRELRIEYARSPTSSARVVRPLGLVLKGNVWYLIADDRRGARRMYRVSRVTRAEVLPHRFERPHDFDLATTWAERKAQFIAAIPKYTVHVRVSPAARHLLRLLQEGAPRLPLPDDLPTDGDGWTHMTLTFERPDSAARLLLQLGGGIEVIDPPEVREIMANEARSLAALYARRRAIASTARREPAHRR